MVKTYKYRKQMKKATTVRFTIKKEIFINRGKKTTCYSVGKNVVGYPRIYYATKKGAEIGKKKLQNKKNK